MKKEFIEVKQWLLEDILSIITSISLLSLVILMTTPGRNINSPEVLILLSISIALFVTRVFFITKIANPSFCYTLEIVDNCLIVIFDDFDKRRLDIQFLKMKRKNYYITLSDGYSVVDLPCNEDVYEFLKEIS